VPKGKKELIEFVQQQFVAPIIGFAAERGEEILEQRRLQQQCASLGIVRSVP